MKPIIVMSNMKEDKVYLGLGSNLGDREANLREALTRLGGFGQVLAESSVYETEPVGFRDQGAFLNMVVRLQTELEPFALLRAVKKIEADMGREATFRNGPRIIDIDILLFNARIVALTDLTIPHPRIKERNFVMVPLAEIDPELAVREGYAYDPKLEKIEKWTK